MIVVNNKKPIFNKKINNKNYERKEIKKCIRKKYQDFSS